MKDRKILGTVEKVALGDVEFADDTIQVWVGIKEVSENLQVKIQQAVEEEKERTAQTMQRLYGRGWKETQIKDLTLNIVARENEPLETSIVVYFDEVENPDMFEGAEFKIDLSEHEMELKEFIVQGITQKFFKL